MKEKVTTLKEVVERVAALPEFSKKVYMAIEKGLYAEAGFSDLVVEEVAKEIGAKPLAVNAAVGKLIEEGLVRTEDYETTIGFGPKGHNKEKYVFLHTLRHSHDLGTLEDLKASLAEIVEKVA